MKQEKAELTIVMSDKRNWKKWKRGRVHLTKRTIHTTQIEEVHARSRSSKPLDTTD